MITVQDIFKTEKDFEWIPANFPHVWVMSTDTFQEVLDVTLLPGQRGGDIDPKSSILLGMSVYIDESAEGLSIAPLASLPERE